MINNRRSFFRCTFSRREMKIRRPVRYSAASTFGHLSAAELRDSASLKTVLNTVNDLICYIELSGANLKTTEFQDSRDTKLEISSI